MYIIGRRAEALENVVRTYGGGVKGEIIPFVPPPSLSFSARTASTY